MSIPAARVKLLSLADELNTLGLTDHAVAIQQTVTSEMHRKRPLRIAKWKQRMSEEKAERIKTLAAQMPDASYHELSVRLGVNVGRISEVLNGKTYQEPTP